MPRAQFLFVCVVVLALANVSSISAKKYQPLNDELVSDDADDFHHQPPPPPPPAAAANARREPASEKAADAAKKPAADSQAKPAKEQNKLHTELELELDDEEFVGGRGAASAAKSAGSKQQNKKKSASAGSATDSSKTASSSASSSQASSSGSRGASGSASAPQTKTSSTGEIIVSAPSSPKPLPLPNRLGWLIGPEGALSKPLFGVIPPAFLIDFAGFFFLAVFIVLYFLGKESNKRIALAWLTAVRTVFASQFYVLGTKIDDHRTALVKESESLYRFYATGRRGCQSALVSLDLKQRQDLLSVLWDLFSTKSDTMTIEIPLLTEERRHSGAEPTPFVMVIIDRSKVRQYKEDNADVRVRCREVNSHALFDLTEDKAMLTDLPDNLIPQIINADTIAVINRYSHYITTLHITDRFQFNEHRNFLKFVMTIPDLRAPSVPINSSSGTPLSASELSSEHTLSLSSPSHILSTVVKLVMHLVDKTALTPIKNFDHAVFSRIRAKADEELHKAETERVKEEILQKKYEAKEKEREEKKAKLSAQIQNAANSNLEEWQIREMVKKQEEKERAKEIKKNQQNRVKVVKA